MNKQIAESAACSPAQAEVQVEAAVDLTPATLDLVGGGQAITSCYRGATAVSLAHK